MSGSGKGLIGLWLYRNGSDWQVKSEAPHHPKLADIQAAQHHAHDNHDGERISVIFTVKNQIGGLVRVLSVFQDLGINVLHIESRKSAMEMSAVSLLLLFYNLPNPKCNFVLSLSSMQRKSLMCCLQEKCDNSYFLDKNPF